MTINKDQYKKLQTLGVKDVTETISVSEAIALLEPYDIYVTFDIGMGFEYKVYSNNKLIDHDGANSSKEDALYYGLTAALDYMLDSNLYLVKYVEEIIQNTSGTNWQYRAATKITEFFLNQQS